MAHDSKKTEMSPAAKVAVGVGLAAAAAAAAGAIFFYGTDAGKKKRKQITSLMLRMKADILDKMEEMKDWTEEEYYAVIDSVADKYRAMKNIDAVEVAALVADLRRHWKAIRMQVEGKPKRKKKTVKTKRVEKTDTK